MQALSSTLRDCVSRTKLSFQLSMCVYELITEVTSVTTSLVYLSTYRYTVQDLYLYGREMSPLAMALAKMPGASLSRSGVRRQAFLSSGVEIFNGF